MREGWEDPKSREKARQSAKARGTSKMQAAANKFWNEPVNKKRNSNKMKNQWQDPAWREKVIAAQREGWKRRNSK